MNRVLNRLLMVPPTLLVLSLSVFLMMELAPGSTASAILDDAADDAAAIELCEQTHCDAPVLERYLLYLGGVLTGDFGVSIRTGRDVGREIGLRLPHTLALSAASILLATCIGASLGMLAAFKQEKRADNIITGFASLSAAMPSFWVALILVSIFALRLDWFPVFGSGSARHYVLPVISITLALIPGIILMTRSGIIDTRRRQFVTVARSKGLSARAVFIRHIQPVAIIPVVTYVGVQTVHLIGSLITIEIIFNLPGLGGLAVQAALDRDPMLLQGVTLCIAVITFAILLAVDVALTLLDPRIARPRAA